MKLCLQYWVQNGQPKKLRFVALEQAFHGETLGVTALGGVTLFRKPFEHVLLDCLHVPPPRHPNDPDQAFAALEKVVSENAETLAAVVLEPLVQGAAGMVTYDSEYLRHARALCDRHDVFLVCDEVFSGYGRTEVDLLGLLAEEGARIDAEVSGEPVCIHGNARMLRRLIRNLLENARRYGSGSSVDASVAPLEEGGGLLRVSDRGAGVPEEERERIFEPFYRLSGVDEPSDGGVGLGLHLVRQIARHHGGDARCTALAGRGTCFEITLRDWIGEGAGGIIGS